MRVKVITNESQIPINKCVIGTGGWSYVLSDNTYRQKNIYKNGVDFDILPCGISLSKKMYIVVILA
jgi:hypothetical protein